MGARRYIDQSEHVLCYLSDGYFASKSCLAELLRAVFLGKPIRLLLEPNPKFGGLTLDECRRCAFEPLWGPSAPV